MRILLLTSLPRGKTGNLYGGAEKTVINLANWLHEHQLADITLVSVAGNGKPYRINPGVSFHGNPVDSAASKISVHFQMLRNTWNAVAQYKPDCIISFDTYAAFYALIHPIYGNIPMVYSLRNWHGAPIFSRIHNFMLQYIIKNARGIVFQTSAVKNAFEELSGADRIVIPNPVYVSAQEWPLCEQTDNRIVAVGRLAEQKNFGLLIDAFADIHEQYPGITLEIYGEGNLRTDLQTKIASMGLQAKVFLMGAFPDVQKRIYGARLFVLPSLYEGMTNALMEAMSIGLPVIASDCEGGGPRELIVDGVNGFLFENNVQSSLIHAMKAVLDMDAKRLQRIRAAAQEICVTHSQDRIFGQWRQFLDMLLHTTR